MFQEILGILIDPQGNFLSFGKYNDEDEYSTNQTVYRYLHGRACMSQIYFYQWHITHPELDLKHYDFSDIFLFEPDKSIDYEIYSYFDKWSQIGYISLYHASYYDTSPLLSGFVPKNISVLQAFRLLSLKDYFPFTVDSEIYKTNEEGNTITLKELFQEVDDTILSKCRTLRLR